MWARVVINGHGTGAVGPGLWVLPVGDDGVDVDHQVVLHVRGVPDVRAEPVVLLQVPDDGVPVEASRVVVPVEGDLRDVVGVVGQVLDAEGLVRHIVLAVGLHHLH